MMSTLLFAISSALLFVAWMLESDEHFTTRDKLVDMISNAGYYFHRYRLYRSRYQEMKKRKNFYNKKAKKLQKKVNTLNDVCLKQANLVERAAVCGEDLLSIVKDDEKIIDRQGQAFDMIVLIACDYDGYNDVEGLKKTIDRIYDIAVKREPELEREDNEKGIPTTVSEV